MKVEAYILAWNESDIIGLVIKHYQKFCDKIVILDNHSTDNTAAIAESMGCEVRKFGTKFFDDYENLTIKNNCWKGSKADWVIVCDCDEVLFCMPAAERNVLAKATEAGETIFRTYGWQIMSDEMPKADLLEITNGYHFSNYSKNIIFNPKAFEAINYNPGAHRIDPIGNVVWADHRFYVLHYKHIGGVQRTIDRYKQYQPRMSRNNRRKGWGIHYDRTVPSLIEEWNERMAKSTPLL